MESLNLRRGEKGFSFFTVFFLHLLKDRSLRAG